MVYGDLHFWNLSSQHSQHLAVSNHHLQNAARDGVYNLINIARNYTFWSVSQAHRRALTAGLSKATAANKPEILDLSLSSIRSVILYHHV